MKPKCEYHPISRRERTRDRAEGRGDKPTKGYEDKGCLTTCEGYNTQCPSFIIIKKRRTLGKLVGMEELE